MKEMVPYLCLAAFILECKGVRGRIVGSFPEPSRVVNAHRGELLGLMAIHLILLAANKVWPRLEGKAKIYSDCLGALQKTTSLPRHRIPSRCRHSDVLKNVMINCSSLTFRLEYEHVDAHQDDGKDFALLKRPAQMNCMCDRMAKGVVWGLAGEKLPKQSMFPLESIAVYVGEDKLSSDMSKCVRFWVHKQIAKEVFAKLSVLDEGKFDEVSWGMVWGALKEAQRMFQIWASKQVMDVAGVNKNLAKCKPRQSKRCPS